MSSTKHDVESQGAKPRDHEHHRHHRWKPHRDWRVWTVVLLMVACILVYVMSDSLSLTPGQPANEPTPALP